MKDFLNFSCSISDNNSLSFEFFVLPILFLCMWDFTSSPRLCPRRCLCLYLCLRLKKTHLFYSFYFLHRIVGSRYHLLHIEEIEPSRPMPTSTSSSSRLSSSSQKAAAAAAAATVVSPSLGGSSSGSGSGTGGAEGGRGR